MGELKSKDTSKNTEYRMIFSASQKVLLKSTKEFYVVDIAASNGVSQSPVLPFFKSGSAGLALELDGTKFSQLSYLYKNYPGVTLVRTRVTPHNVAPLFKHADVPKDFEVLNVDIDSFDLDLAIAILSADYRPKLISIEINEKIPPPLFFNVPFSSEHSWDGSHFYGCSIIAATSELSKFDYRLVGMEGNNALFQSAYSTYILPSLDATSAWMDGYKNKEDTPLNFPYNSDVSYWLDLKPEEALRAIRNHFSSYAGKFELFISLHDNALD
jgi:hypothetical protein